MDIPSTLAAAEEHRNAGRPGDAFGAYAEILAADPGHADALGRMRSLTREGNRDDLAAPYLRAAWELQPDRVDWLIDWSEISLRAIGVAESIAVLEDAVARQPRAARLHARLGRLYEIYLRAAEAKACYRRALEIDPNLADANASLAMLLYDEGSYEEALAASQREIELAPDQAVAHCCIAQTRMRQERWAEALPAFRRALETRPTWSVAAAGLVHALLRLGEYSEAAAAAVAASEKVGYSTSLLAVRYYAHLAAGDVAAAREILDFDRAIMIRDFPTPLGFNDLAGFHRALANELRSEPSLIWEPIGRTTRGGHQTSTLMLQPGLAMSAFLHNLRPHIDAYAETLPADHPFRTRTVATYGLDVWATILDSGGHQTPHIHRSGHVSGVYYVELPQTMGQTPDDNAGWIEFGRAPDEMKLPLEPPTRRVQPYEGMLVLFPSYTYHRTIPFEGGGQRISIAFDVNV